MTARQRDCHPEEATQSILAIRFGHNNETSFQTNALSRFFFLKKPLIAFKIEKFRKRFIYVDKRNYWIE